MKKILILFSFVIIQSSFSQEYNNRLYSFNLDNITYYKYENTNIYANLNDIPDGSDM